MLDSDDRRLLTPSLRRQMPAIAARAADLDADDSFPHDDIACLAAAGTLAACFIRPTDGRAAHDPDDLMETLQSIGHASLPLGRLFEGHVNAAMLVRRYGTAHQRDGAWRDARAGALFAVWNTQGADEVRLVHRAGRLELTGGKIFASGAGHAARPLITARDDSGALLMVLPRLDGAPRADLSRWKAHGMRASASGAFCFTGLRVEHEDILGADGDYHREPHFSAGAWRFCAVQLGGLERLVEEARSLLRGQGRDGDPHQSARMGEALIAVESAHLWVERAARIAEAEELESDPEAVRAAVAYVNLARCAVERCALQVLELVQRSIGLSAFLRASPLERLSRDLATYLRQPAPDRALCAGAAYGLQEERPVRELWR